MKNKLDAVLNRIQLYSYLLPTVKIGNAIMDFREKYTLSGLQERDKVEEYEKYLCEKADILENICAERGIGLWDEDEENIIYVSSKSKS